MKELVLVGGGHSHVQVLRALRMGRLQGYRVTVVVDRPVAIYSGMVPGFVARQYQRHELEIDLRPLCRLAGARLLVARATGFDLVRKTVGVQGRPEVRYDVLSVNVGSTVAGLEVPGVREYTIPTRPIGDFATRLPEAAPADRDAPYRVVIVGAGAGGVELAFCLRERLRAEGFDVTVTVVSRDRPLPRRPERFASRVVRDGEARGLRFERGEVIEVRRDAVVLVDRTIPSDAVLWVSGAAGPPFLANGLPTDDRGFVRVRDSLQIHGTDDAFAVGDCAVPDGWTDIPKAGVYAVRQGPVLVDNLERLRAGLPLRPYKAQRDFLSLLNYGDGTAIGAKWGLQFSGPWAFWYKDRIDRAFMHKFQALRPDGRPAEPFARGLPPMPEMDMVCGGCAAKVGQTPLHKALGRLPPAEPDPSVVLGIADGEDVAAIRGGVGVVAFNVDAISAFTDDPWLVGRVGAANALSDVLAKGARPKYALCVVTVPEAEADHEEVLFQALSGVRASLDAAGVHLIGGHSNLGMTLGVALTVWGRADTLWPLGGLRVGDAIVLTGAIGTGVLYFADMRGRAAGPWMAAAEEHLLRPHPADLVRAAEPHAVTDVTGFGLAGHLGEMLRASGVGAELDLAAIPLLPGVSESFAAGLQSTYHPQNRDLLKAIEVDASAKTTDLESLFDPQTAGPWLVGLPAGRAEGLVAALRDAGEPAAIIGRATAQTGALFRVR